MADVAVCPECGAPRPRRAAGCPRCGHIFQDVPAAEAGLPPERSAAPRVNLPEPRPADASAVRRSGWGSCLLLAAICGVLTLIAGVALYVLARAELGHLFVE